MISIYEKKVDPLFLLFKKEIDQYNKKIISNLKNLKNRFNNQEEIDYLDYLIAQDKKLITGSLADLSSISRRLNKILSFNITINRHKDFRNQILDALEYSKRRSDFYPRFFQLLGVKSCVYCNAHLCIVAEDYNKKIVARFQVDHQLPKDSFPGLSVMLLNLVPACSSCNNKKGNKKVNFSLYSADENLNSKKSNFRFEIKNKNTALASFVSSRNSDVIKIGFIEPGSGTNNNSLNKIFAIEGIYNTQIDLVEEMILKSHIYNETFKKELLDKYTSLFKDEATLNRMIVGNYINDGDIHKRPMSKFMQDIAKQIGLIK